MISGAPNDPLVDDFAGLTFLGSDGGPFLVLARDLLPAWEGGELPSNGRLVEATFRWNDPDGLATDYDRACDIDDWIGAIPVANGQALVLSGDQTICAWLEHRGQVYIVRIIYGDDDLDFPKMIDWFSSGFADARWESAGLNFEVRMQPLVLFHASCTGNEVIEGRLFSNLSITVPAGEYVMSKLYSDDQQNGIVIHRFDRL